MGQAGQNESAQPMSVVINKRVTYHLIWSEHSYIHPCLFVVVVGFHISRDHCTRVTDLVMIFIFSPFTEAVRLIKGLSGATLEEIEAGAKGWLKNCRACVNSATKRYGT